MGNIIQIVITEGFRWTYFEWFILGFYKLQEQGTIRLRFKLPVGSKALSFTNQKQVLRVADKLRRLFEKDSYNMSGYIDFPVCSGRTERRYFTIDCADSPYLFDSKKLEAVDVYFKMQCPMDLDAAGFPLTDTITIPWLDHAHVDGTISGLTGKGERKLCKNFSANRNKIKPLMVGPRALSQPGFSRAALEHGYENYLKDRKRIKSKRLMCYFGNSAGPKSEENVTAPDFDRESELIGYFGSHISHPNEKRAVVADYLAKMENCDARVITRGYADTGEHEHKELVVPLSRFCAFISDFQYNINVSGYRKSLPNRFIESLMVDTAVLTDKLAVKWYLPFDRDEVVETIEMGYLPNEEVDWRQFEKDLTALPRPDTKHIEDCFEQKWRPEAVAEYIINAVRSSGAEGGKQ